MLPRGPEDYVDLARSPEAPFGSPWRGREV
jgi:hypothetical protein